MGQFAPVPANQTYQWRFNATDIIGANAVTYVIAAATAADAGTYSVVVTNAGGSSVASTTLTVRPLAAPVITSQPQSAAVQVGQSASFFYTATGSFPRTHQWRKNGSDIAGANDSFYVISAVSTADAGTYSVVISNSKGSITSAGAPLTVNAATPVVIASGSPANVSVTQANPATLEVFLSSGSSPYTYQWRKNGVAIDGATGSKLLFSAATLADSGNYSVVVSNILGPTTSREATLTVVPATPVTITQQPQAQAVYFGQSTYISVSQSGSSPLTYQWLKDGQPIANATTSAYSINATAFTDAGDYSVVITNAAGSVTSAAGRLTVNPAVLPTITQQPSSLTVKYGDSIWIYANATGSPPLDLHWKKNDVIVTEGSTISYFPATPAYNGDYVFEATNPAGTVKSNVITLTVLPPALPTITSQPSALAVPLGSQTYAGFSVYCSSVGTGPLTFQWLKNGLPISGATSSGYSPTYTSATDAGDYSVVITGPAGSVQSDIGKLTILPPELPSVPDWNYYNQFNADTVAPGMAKRFYAPASTGSGLYGSQPCTYQWCKDGIAIPGATTWEYDLLNVHESDFGIYTVTIANAAGVCGSPPLVFQPSTSNAAPWLDAAIFGNVVYFLALAPARIERYDLGAERWLSTVLLTQTPTAFLPTTEGVYVAYDRALARRSPDLSTETALLNAADSIGLIFAVSDWLYYYSSGNLYRTVNRTTLTPGPTAQGAEMNYTAPGVSVAPGSRKVFTRAIGSSDETTSMVTVAPDGTFSKPVQGTLQGYGLGGVFGGSARTTVFPNEQFVALDCGAVFRTSDLSYAGSFGADFNDLTFLADGTPVVLRRNKLTTFRRDALLENAQTTLSTVGIRAFAQGSNVFVFGAPATAGTVFSVTKVAADDFTALATQVPIDSPNVKYSVDDAFLGSDGVINVFSRSQQSLIRWSTATGSFLPSLPLRNAPWFAWHQPGNRRALMFYPSGELTEIPLSASGGLEQSLGFISPTNHLETMADLGSKIILLLRAKHTNLDVSALLGANAETNLVGVGSSEVDLAWDPTRHRLYSNYNGSLYFRFFADQDALPTPSVTSGSVTTTTSFVRFNADYSKLVTSTGHVFSADLQPAGNLANDITDAAWLRADLYTLRTLNGETQVQRWAADTFLSNGSLTLHGVPVRIFRLTDTQVVVVTTVQGRPTFHILDQDMNLVTGGVTPIAITAAPQPQVVNAGAQATFTVSQTGASSDVSYQWLRNGLLIAGANNATYTVSGTQPAATGLYSVTVASTSTNSDSAPVILGLTTTAKTVGAAKEVNTDVVHPNGNIYDQILLQGSAATVTADPGQALRMSFVDLNKDIVQLEFSGGGSLSLVLDSASGPATPENYNQPTVNYLKGHAGIVITGADETTNISIFSVGRANAINQALFRDDVNYDGLADLAFIAITSKNGKFGGVRAADASFFATRGFTGLYAPDVQFTGPVYIEDINAFDDAVPVIVVGSASETKITGGNLFQANGRAVQVSGLTKLKFADGTDSHGKLLRAQANQGRLENHGLDVTNQIVVNPTP
ncbi:MAG TPA: immunoglobulin domain-containing protein [Opitutaceae bacterium]|nr:immunoglobulin domain-containing protein [Opitutaceae bacterium]